MYKASKEVYELLGKFKKIFSWSGMLNLFRI